MPVHQTALKEQTLSQYKNHSYEYLLLSWLLSDGWDASMPSLDVYAKTDIQILDGRTVYRIQVKSLYSADEILLLKINGKMLILTMSYISQEMQNGAILFQHSRKKSEI